jgi:2Fe-2S ferredoxin
VTRIVFVTPAGERQAVEAVVGQTVMETAVRHGVAGIDADCGGACACATCHVHIDAGWRAACGEPSSMERSMLDFAVGVDACSRLACQIRVDAAMDGLVVTVAQEQG